MIRADRAQLRPRRGPRAGARPRARQPRRQRLQRPGTAAAGAALRRLLPAARATTSAAPAPAARAERIDFLDEQRAVATGATYTSCPARRLRRPGLGAVEPTRVEMDFEANEGVAESAVLRFYGVPILAAPVLSFPLTDERKSGWLPPSVNLDSKSGLQVSVPYYWNIAPNRDATLTPDGSAPSAASAWTPSSATSSRATTARSTATCCPTTAWPGARATRCDLTHDGQLPQRRHASALRAAARLRRRLLEGLPARRAEPDAAPAADRDLQRAAAPLAATGPATRACRAGRCCRTRASAHRGAVRARAADRRALRAARRPAGFEVAFEAEFNRFADPADAASPTARRPARACTRWAASAARSSTPGWALTPEAVVQRRAATRSTSRCADGQRAARSRVIPSFSLDSALDASSATPAGSAAPCARRWSRACCTSTRRTATRASCPTSTPAAKDFNFESIFTENAFSGVDRVSDAHQLTAGVTTRFLDPTTGAEALRLGLVQRYLFRDQRITARTARAVSTQRFSDLLLLGSTSAGAALDARRVGAVQPRHQAHGALDRRRALFAGPVPHRQRHLPADARTERTARTRLAMAASTVTRTPRQAASAGRRARRAAAARAAAAGTASGRVNYSTARQPHHRFGRSGSSTTPAAGSAAIVAERLSTGRSEATTRLLLQLELVGLSRLGSNPLQVLKDNIPGYRLLREDRAAPAPSSHL